MRVFGLSLALLAVFALRAAAAPGDYWILGIDHIDNAGAFTTYTGAGYSGAMSIGSSQFVGNAYGRAGVFDSVARIYWKLGGLSINNGTPVPTETALYSLQFIGTPGTGRYGWQPVESQFGGITGEQYPYDNRILWDGESNTNHQYIAANGANDRNWHALGPGPHTPSSALHNASGSGTYMWLTAGSWLYAKWQFNIPSDCNCNRSWSAILLKQEPPTLPATVAGDYNKNGAVDAADYVLWRKTLGQQGAGMPADGFPDGIIDDYDYDWWVSHFGSTSGSGAGSELFLGVPEPASAAFVALFSLLWSFYRPIVTRRGPARFKLGSRR
jgi:hypothetical protein